MEKTIKKTKSLSPASCVMSGLVAVSLLCVQYLILRHALSMILNLYRLLNIHLHRQRGMSLHSCNVIETNTAAYSFYCWTSTSLTVSVWCDVFHIIWRFNFCLFHSVLLFPTVIASFLSDRSQTDRVRRRKSPETLLSFPLLCSRRFFWWIWKKTRVASPPYALLHTPLPSSHILSFTHFSFGCFLKVSYAHKHKCMQMCTCRRHRQISRCQNLGCKEGMMRFFQIYGEQKCSKTV